MFSIIYEGDAGHRLGIGAQVHLVYIIYLKIKDESISVLRPGKEIMGRTTKTGNQGNDRRPCENSENYHMRYRSAYYER